MTCALPRLDICITRGATVDIPIRFESGEWRYVPITGIAQTAPLRITAPAHSVPHGWRGVLVNIVGPDELNSARALGKLRDADYRSFSVIDANTLEINDINGFGLPAYASGGQIVIQAPLDMSDIVDARLQINDASGATLDYLTVANGRLIIGADDLRISMTATESSALGYASGLYDIELVTTTGRVIKPVSPESIITVSAEQTTTA